ncbi:MAG: leucine-rich repeat domain-containing protein [Clostridia bacterium]|nr:leucine-rich repeat domain-containing protein [Clostridia bacterium]
MAKRIKTRNILFLGAITLLLTVLLAVSVSAATRSGTCGAEGSGSNLTWSYDTTTCVLTINGRGDMADYDPSAFSAPWAGFIGNIQTVRIGSGVTSIGDNAFYYCANITDVTLPESITKIGSYAFYHCISLPKIALPSGATDIGELAFAQCSSLVEITLPRGLEKIPRGLFEGCSGLVEMILPSGVTTIDRAAFSDCSSLAKITLPESLRVIGEAAFAYCSSLTSIDLPNSATSIGYAAFQYCYALTSIVLPDGVKTIGDAMFYECKKLTSVTIPDSVTSIAGRAFYKCSSLASVDIPDGVRTIKNQTFYGCSNLRSVTLPTSLTAIEKNAFSGCPIPTLSLPDSLTTIGESAFSNCGISTVAVGKGVTTIGTDAFKNCSNLYAVYISDMDAWCNISFANIEANPLSSAANLYLDGTLVTDVVFPDGTTQIKNYVFYSGRCIERVTIPDGVTDIGAYAFWDCSLTGLTIPDSVTTIGECAFYGCDKIKTLNVGTGVSSIGKAAFSDCNGITKVNIKDLSAWCRIRFDGAYANPLNNWGDLYLNGTLLTKITIPDDVTAIGAYAFYGYEALTDVFISNSVKSIGRDAFGGCEGLTRITIPQSVTTVGAGAFSRCTNLLTASVLSRNISFSTSSVDPTPFHKNTTVYGFVGGYRGARAHLATDTVAAFEFSATYTPDATKAGLYLPLSTFTRADGETALSLHFLFVEGATGALYVKSTDGTYLALYGEDGMPLALGSRTTDFAVVYNDNTGITRYYVDGVIPLVGDEKTPASYLPVHAAGFHTMSAVTDTWDTLDSVAVKNIYNVNSSDTADFVGVQYSLDDTSRLRLVAGLDMLYYGTVGFEVQLYSNDILQGTVRATTKNAYTGILSNKSIVWASDCGYQYLAAIAIHGIDRTEYPSSANVYFIVRTYTAVGDEISYGKPVKIIITHNAQTKEHSYTVDLSYAPAE